MGPTVSVLSQHLYTFSLGGSSWPGLIGVSVEDALDKIADLADRSADLAEAEPQDSGRDSNDSSVESEDQTLADDGTVSAGAADPMDETVEKPGEAEEAEASEVEAMPATWLQQWIS